MPCCACPTIPSSIAAAARDSRFSADAADAQIVLSVDRGTGGSKRELSRDIRQREKGSDDQDQDRRDPYGEGLSSSSDEGETSRIRLRKLRKAQEAKADLERIRPLLADSDLADLATTEIRRRQEQLAALEAKVIEKEQAARAHCDDDQLRRRSAKDQNS